MWHHKHLNTNEHSNKFNFVSEVDNTEDKGDTCTEREITVNCMQMPLNTSEISDKNDFITEIQIYRDNATYAKVEKNYNNECSSKIHLNTTGISDKANFATGTDNTEKISKTALNPEFTLQITKEKWPQRVNLKNKQSFYYNVSKWYMPEQGLRVWTWRL